MSSGQATVPSEFVSLVAAEIACGVDTAVESWMAQVENALQDDHLSTLGRMKAVQHVLTKYKHLTGKTALRCRTGGDLGSLPFEVGPNGR